MANPNTQYDEADALDQLIHTRHVPGRQAERALHAARRDGVGPLPEYGLTVEYLFSAGKYLIRPAS